MSQSFPCQGLDSTLQVRNLFPLLGAQKTTLITIGSVAMLVSILNILAWVTVKPLRQPPGDILLVITIFSILKLWVVFITMIYDDVNPFSQQLPSNYGVFCTITGFLDIACELSESIYVLSFSIYYIKRIRNPLKAWKSRSRQMHVLCASLVLLAAFVAFFSGGIGPSVFGYCSLVLGQVSNYLEAVLNIAYVVFVIIFSIIFLGYIRKISLQHSTIKQFFKYYTIFIFIFCVKCAIVATCYTIMAVACSLQRNKQIFMISRIIAHSFVSFTPILVFLVILSNPQFRRIFLYRTVSSLYQRYKKWMEKKLSVQDLRPSFYDELMTTNRKTVLIELANLAQLQNGYLADMKDQTRKCLLSTLLGCLSIFLLELQNTAQGTNELIRSSIVAEDKQNLFSWNYTQVYSFTLANQIVQYYKNLFPGQFPTIAIKFIVYAPNVMKVFRNSLKSQELSQEISPVRNQKEIQMINQMYGDGGRSGQLFFFNHDRSLILKSMSSKQKTVYLARLQKFHKHYQKHPHSIIVKFYSVFTAVNADTKQQLHFMLMGNVTNSIPKKYVLKVYDLKGSQLNRRVLSDKDEEDEQSQQSKRTLKDVDFERLQEKIWIDKDQGSFVRQAIAQDVSFLSRNGLIDYSLLVIKLDYVGLKRQEQQYNKMLRGVRYFRSIRQQGVVYIFGIIDYLQTWNIIKKGQKWYKSLFNNQKQISSQDPTYYCQRFMQFVDSILKI